MGTYNIKPALLQRAVNVVVVGAGGTGSQILTGLAQLHLAMVALGHPGGLNVVAMDDDLVSEANVGRQMFYPPDVGLPKAHVLINRINMTFGMDWTASATRVDQKTDFMSVDLVIGCVDNRRARKAILGAMQRGKGGLWLDVGNRLHDGQAILGEVIRKGPVSVETAINRLPHAADLFPEIIDDSQDGTDDTPSCSLAEALEKQSLFVNRGMALYALNLLWELFRFGKIDYHGVFVNLKTARTSPLAIDQATWERFGYKPEAPKPEKKTQKQKAKSTSQPA